MSMFLLLIARILTANGVTAAVCGNDLVIGATCKSNAPASPPPASPPPPQAHTPTYQTTVPLSISNGF